MGIIIAALIVIPPFLLAGGLHHKDSKDDIINALYTDYNNERKRANIYEKALIKIQKISRGEK